MKYLCTETVNGPPDVSLRFCLSQSSSRDIIFSLAPRREVVPINVLPLEALKEFTTNTRMRTHPVTESGVSLLCAPLRWRRRRGRCQGMRMVARVVAPTTVASVSVPGAHAAVVVQVTVVIGVPNGGRNRMLSNT